jgi:dTDP-4-dehydrorhamnose reductase
MEKSLEGMSNVVVARTSLVLTLGDGSATRPHGKGIKFIVDALTGTLPGQSGTAFTLFTDELRCMSFSDDFAAALVELAGPDCDHEGLIHVVADEVSNRFELARRVAAHLGLSAKFGVNVVAGLSAQSGMNRPLNCALSTELLVSVLKTVRVRGISDRLPCHAQALPAATL